MHNAFLLSFKESYSSKSPSDYDINRVLECISPVVTHEANSRLSGPYTFEEVEHAILGMQPLYSPGPDEFSLVFYHHYW